MKEIRFLVDGLPRGKARARFTKSGKVYNPKSNTDFENYIKLRFKSAKPKNFVPIETEVKVWIECCVQNKMAKPDLDNIAKIFLDALNGIAYIDDKQVTKLTIFKEEGLQHVTQIIIQWEN